MAHNARRGNHVPAERVASEQLLGITERTSPIDFSWGADIRKRFTDFLVYEVGKDGTVRHLTDFEELEAPKQTNNEPSQPGSSQPVASAAETTAQQENVPVTVKPVDEADRTILEQLLGQEAAASLIQLDAAIQAKTPIDKKTMPLLLGVVSDRQKRGTIHQEIRRIFSSRIETSTDSSGNMTAQPFKPMSSNWRGQTQGQGRRTDNRNPQSDSRRDTNRSNGYKSWSQLGGEYLHCTLYKENKDTMDALNLIARMLKIKVSNFGFSGTKDRRAATVQRISIHRQRDTNIIWLNSRLQGLKLGDFKYSKHPIQLGQHGGNEFVITLKNVEHARGANCSTAVRLKMIRQSVHIGLRHLNDCGFINYFGLQRFGTHDIGTHELGIRILQGDFEGAVKDILYVEKGLAQAAQGIPSASHQRDHRQGSVDHTNGHNNGHNQGSDDQMNRARALGLWYMTQDASAALQILPKRFSAETSIIKHLGRAGQNRDYMGALLTITRGLRMMYIHAYQSYVWNHIASYRWAKYGTKVIPGDLILVDNQVPAKMGSTDDDAPDINGEWENFYAQVRTLTAEDIASGKYTIFDIVLPQPGYDVTYPQNDIGAYYKTFMGSDKGGRLDPYDMRRPQREFSMSGGYRHFIGTFGTKPEYFVRTYSDDNEQMYPTDLDLVVQKKADQAEAKKLQLEAKAPSVAKWNEFAQNTRVHDAAQDEVLKRRRSEEPTPPAVRVNETWVETSHDGSLKRAKISEHHKIEVHDNPAALNAEDDLMEVDPRPLTPAAASGKDLAGQEFLLKRLQEAAGQTPDSQLTRSATPMAGILTPQAQSDVLAATPNSSTATPSTSRAGQTVIKPKFETIDEDPITKFSPANYVYDEEVEGDKIAVVLKFQLRASSYATIVLRELMGTIEGEGKSSLN